MPFKIEKRGNKYQVVNASTGKIKGTHATKAQANKQLRALYVNVSDVKRGGSNRSR